MQSLENRLCELADKYKLKYYVTKWLDPYLTWLEKLLLAEHQVKQLKRNSFPLSPSSAARCRKELAYKLDNWKKPGTWAVDPPSIRRMRVFKDGWDGERKEMFLISQYPGARVTHRNHGVFIGKIDDNEVWGEWDALIHLPTGPEIIDIKRVNTRKFKSNKLPSIDNVLQQLFYLNTDDAKALGVKRANLWYVDKDTGEFTSYTIEANPPLIEEIWLQWVELYRKWEKGEEIGRDFVYGEDWQCNYCDFSKYCLQSPPSKTKVIDVTIPECDNKQEQILELWKHGFYETYKDPNGVWKVVKNKTTYSVSFKKNKESK